MGAHDGEGRKVDGVIYYIKEEFLSNYPTFKGIICIRPDTRLREDLLLSEEQIRRIANKLEEAYLAKISREGLRQITTVQELSDLMKAE